MKNDMTEEQIENCLILAAFLRSDPRIRKEGRFNMNRFVGDNWEGKPDLSCGTSACAAGWAATIPHFRNKGVKLDSMGNIENNVLLAAFGDRGTICFSGSIVSDPDHVADLLETAALTGEHLWARYYWLR